MKQLSPVLLASPYKSQLLNEIGAQADWGKLFHGHHLEPGVVKYDNGDGTSRTYLLTREAIARMRPTAEGKPIVGRSGNFNHKSVSPRDYQDGKVDGIAVECLEGSEGWEDVRFVVWDAETKTKCLDDHQLSCAYIPTEVEEAPGLWHNVAYDAVINNGEYTHFAVVPNPRYEGAVIFANSLKEGIRMFKLWFKKDNAEQTVELDKSVSIKMDGGKEVALSELVNAFVLKQAEDAKVTAEAFAQEAINDDSIMDIDGKKVTMKELKAAYTAKCNADAGQMREDIVSKHAEDLKTGKVSPSAQAAIEHLAKLTGMDAKQVLKDLRGDSRIATNEAPADPATDAATTGLLPKAAGESAAAPAPGSAAHEAGETPAEEAIEEKALAEAKAKEAELKASQDAEAAKKAEEEAKLKAEAEKKNALEKSKADKKALERFNSLRAAAEERGGVGPMFGFGVSTPSDKENLGQDRYGSGR